MPNPIPSSSLSFPFNKIEVLSHVTIVIIHLFLITKLIVDYASQHEEFTHLSPSYLTDLIGKKRDSHDVQWETYR